MNSDLKNNKNLDENFEIAYDLCQKEFSHAELIYMLLNGSVAEKQISALKFDYVNDNTDAKALLSNLTDCDGKIREAVALKINAMLNKDNNVRKIFASLSSKVFADATIDINANICRLIVDSSALLIDYKNFSLKYTECIINFIREALDELDKFICKDKKYLINKQLFKLYWCLEALYYFYKFVDVSDLKLILEKCSVLNEYTIREKVAQILAKTNYFTDIKEQMSKDENYYVKQILNHPCVF